ncbi:MAG: TetR/AcrR family transcriptional regulator [Polyangiaceae bacterium]|nr:TetR/AcrR family transcriptional regulator [Polyangiaceae bacterium]
MSKAEPEEREDVRERIVVAAARLIAEGGRDAATTRAVAAAASVQAPTIYRFFGDKQGLLDAVAEHAVATYVAKKAKRKPHPDPVDDLREGWDTHVAFGLTHPELFALMSRDVRPGEASPATLAGMDVLRRRIRRIAAAGRLRVTEERALALLQSVCIGIVKTLLEEAEPNRDLGLSELAREAAITAICGEAIATPSSGVRGAAIALRASLDDTAVLTKGERSLLEELLERIASGAER